MKSPLPLVAAALAATLGFVCPAALRASIVTQGDPYAPVSLAGDWRFAMDRADTGFTEQWFNKDLTDHIQLPGILQAQGYGDDIATDTPWVLTLGARWWATQPASLKDHFSVPGHVEVPFLSQPPKHYLGVAWYQRDIEIPDSWTGRRIVLFLEHPHWQSTVWIDGQQYLSQDSLVAPHVTDLGVLTPGAHRLTIRVDNRTMISGSGHLTDAHSVSDSLGATWNGIVGRIELSSTSLVWIDDAQVFPNVSKKTVTVKVKIGNSTGQPGYGTIGYQVGGGDPAFNIVSNVMTTTPVTWDAKGGTAQFDVALGNNTQPWDEFHPNLETLTLLLTGSTGTPGATGNAPSSAEYPFQPGVIVEGLSTAAPTYSAPGVISSGSPKSPDDGMVTAIGAPVAAGFVTNPSGATSATSDNSTTPTSPFTAPPPISDQRVITFGLREVSFSDKDLFLNGDLINIRSTHDGGDFPLTGYPAMDVASWKAIFQVCKDYGLNGMRFHSWCPPDAAFTAADEMGFYLIPECGMWNTFGPPAMAQRLEDETARILKAYGNHPSFILLSPSNEPGGGYTSITPEWAAEWYKKDPRRLYAAGTGWNNPAQVNGGEQYAALVRFASGQLRGNTGWFGNDFRTALENVHIPVLAHEVGQWCAYPDFNVINEFTGYLRPSNYDIFRYIADQQGLLDWDPLFAWASGRFQLECYKEEIEANLRTPGLSGFQLLDLHDYLGQGTALIGVVDAFWKPKSYVTADEFRQFSGPIVPLARLYQRTFTSDQPFDVAVELYQFGDGTLNAAAPYWKITDSSGKTVVEGKWDVRDIPVGKNIPIGNVTTDLSKLPAPGQYKLAVGLSDTKVENNWNFWVYPAQVSDTVPDGVTVTSSWPDAQTALAAGGKVLFIPSAADLDPTLDPPMQNVPVFWNRQMNPKFDAMLGLVCDKQSGALAEFPTDVNCDWQWTQIINGVRSINLNSAPHELHPIVLAIDDWNRDWRLGVIFECKVGTGSLLVSAIDFTNSRGGVIAQQLRRSLLDYMASDKFAPVTTLTEDQVRNLWVTTRAPAGTPDTTATPAAAVTPAPAVTPGQPGPDVYEGPAASPPAPAPQGT